MAKYTLKNGAHTDSSLAKEIFSRIVKLTNISDGKLFLKELFFKAKDENYRIFLTPQDALIDHQLLQNDGTINKEYINIILSSMTYDDEKDLLTIQNPLVFAETSYDLLGQQYLDESDDL